jgi:hypothetical protein
MTWNSHALSVMFSAFTSRIVPISAQLAGVKTSRLAVNLME